MTTYSLMENIRMRNRRKAARFMLFTAITIIIFTCGYLAGLYL